VTERIAYNEFGLFHENAAEYGIRFDGPPTVRRTSVEIAPEFSLSALVWGTGEPEFVFLHGGAQNAHTWDTVALALGRPMVAIDLPGHGHSDASPGAVAPQSNAEAVAVAIRALAPTASAVVGMSLGGLTTIALAAHAPELVRKMVLVDITPGVTGHKAQAITAFVNGPKTFPSFEELLARTIEFNPTRTEASLRRGILHNALQLEDGSWVWRYRRFDQPSPIGEPAADATPAEGGASNSAAPTSIENRFSPLWDMLGAVQVPVLLVRGMLKQSVVDDADEDEFRKRVANQRVERIDNAGHSVQGDTPLELAALIADFVDNA
jgi:pimeloyl-ACP methyl ester carboxylesterase